MASKRPRYRFREFLQRVHLDELVRVVRLRLDVDADDVEAGAVVAD
jgi:hypothetical protein